MSELNWLLFLAASLAVIASPGQDMVLVVSRGLGQGARAGVVTASGISMGLIGHTLLAAFGVGALVAASDIAFNTLRIVGAAYLAWLGLRLILSAGAQLTPRGAPMRSAWRLFLEGAIANLSNPKIILFYFAFLPQFVPSASTSPTRDVLALGLAFAVLTFVVKGPVGVFAGALSEWVRERPNVLVGVHRISGLVLIGFGLRLLLDQRD